jgi:hypothetical protein
MVDFLRSLPKIFVERYLNTHALYLKSIADVTAHLYDIFRGESERVWKNACRNMLVRLDRADSIPRRRDTDFETFHFRNLRNCWYHESALYDPLDDIDSRLRFAAWKIIQCYYAVFSSIASLVCLDNTQYKSHDAILNHYISNFICNRNRKEFFLPPVNFYLNQQGVFSEEFSKMVNWEYADYYHLPAIKKCLKHTKKELKKEQGREANIRIGIPHYLKILRDWANYQDAYIFFRLYGDKVKEDLDFSLKRITFIHCVQTEFFMLRTFGWGAMQLQYETFIEELNTNLKIDSPSLVGRFDCYSGKLDMFRP